MTWKPIVVTEAMENALVSSVERDAYQRMACAHIKGQWTEGLEAAQWGDSTALMIVHGPDWLVRLFARVAFRFAILALSDLQ